MGYCDNVGEWQKCQIKLFVSIPEYFSVFFIHNTLSKLSRYPIVTISNVYCNYQNILHLNSKKGSKVKVWVIHVIYDCSLFAQI